MARHTVYVIASLIGVIIATLTISSTLFTTNAVMASLGGQQKDVSCQGGMHTQNYCDGYHIGQGDCENGNNYRGMDMHHTKNWRDGYNNGWFDKGC